jgi:PPE-repeat protein
MDFGMLPPEVNSGRIHSGPGPGSLLSAARAWTELGSELHWAAESIWSTVSALTEGAWLGPSSLAMAAAVTPYVRWLSATAAQADRAAGQATAAAGAYEAAFAATVPPALVAANRAALAALIATNILGQNAPAIAATEAAYFEMWAQDATAMYGYAASSASATAVEPFTPPPPTSGHADRAAAAARAAASAHTTTLVAESTTPQTLSEVPVALQALASPTVPSTSTQTLTLLSALNLLSYPGRFAAYPLNFLSKALSFSKSAAAPASAATAATGLASPGPVTVSGVVPGPGNAIPATASMGGARVVGPMSVPHSWSGATPASAATGPTSLPGSVPGSVGTSPAGMSTATPVMPVATNSNRGSAAGAPRYDLRPTVVPRSPAAG